MIGLRGIDINGLEKEKLAGSLQKKKGLSSLREDKNSLI